MSGIKSKFQRVMVIDDNQIDVYIASKLMMKRNFSESVLPYTSAIAALDFLVGNQNNPHELPDIIFVDIYMPLMSGFEFLDAFDKLPPALKKLCRIFVVTSSIDEYDVQRVKESSNVEGFGIKTISADFLNSITSSPLKPASNPTWPTAAEKTEIRVSQFPNPNSQFPPRLNCPDRYRAERS